MSVQSVQIGLVYDPFLVAYITSHEYQRCEKSAIVAFISITFFSDMMQNNRKQLSGMKTKRTEKNPNGMRSWVLINRGFYDYLVIDDTSAQGKDKHTWKLSKQPREHHWCLPIYKEDVLIFVKRLKAIGIPLSPHFSKDLTDLFDQALQQQHVCSKEYKQTPGTLTWLKSIWQ